MSPISSFKEMMTKLQEDEVNEVVNEAVETAKTPSVKVDAPTKFRMDDKYNFAHRWGEALVNSEFALKNTKAQNGHEIVLPREDKRLILEIGVYEGFSSCFWSDFYLDHPESRLVSIDPFTGSYEHHEKPENYPTLAQIGQISRDNISKSKNPGKCEVITGYSQLKFGEIVQRFGCDPFIDILYVDGAHDTNGVVRDLSLYGPLVKDGGLIWCDDYANHDVKRGVDLGLSCICQPEVALFTGSQLIVKVSPNRLDRPTPTPTA